MKIMKTKSTGSRYRCRPLKAFENHVGKRLIFPYIHICDLQSMTSKRREGRNRPTSSIAPIGGVGRNKGAKWKIDEGNGEIEE